MIAELDIELTHSKVPSFVFPHSELLQFLLSPSLFETPALLKVTLFRENVSALLKDSSPRVSGIFLCVHTCIVLRCKKDKNICLDVSSNSWFHGTMLFFLEIWWYSIWGCWEYALQEQALCDPDVRSYNQAECGEWLGRAKPFPLITCVPFCKSLRRATFSRAKYIFFYAEIPLLYRVSVNWGLACDVFGLWITV